MDDTGRTDKFPQEKSDDEDSHRGDYSQHECLCARNSSVSKLKTERLVKPRNVIEYIVI